MKGIPKVFIIIIAIFLPIIVLAADSVSVPFGGGRYTLRATLSGNGSGSSANFGFNNNGALNLKGVDPNATVKFDLTGSSTNTGGLYIVERNTKAPAGVNNVGTYPNSKEFKVSALQNRQIEAQVSAERATKDGADKNGEKLTMKVEGAGMAGTNNGLLPSLLLPSTSRPEDEPATTSSDTPGTVNDKKSPSDLPSSGSGSKITLVPCNGATDCTIEKLKDMAANIYNYLAGFGALVAVGVIVVAGFSYIKSAGDPSKMKEAKQKIVYAIIGLVVLGISVLLVNTILKVFDSNVRSVESIQPM